MVAAVNAQQATPIALQTYLDDPYGWYVATVVNRQMGTRYTAETIGDLPDDLIEMCLALQQLPPDE